MNYQEIYDGVRDALRCEAEESLRDRFAMAALSGNLGNLPIDNKDIAECAYEIADAMMAAREK